MAEIIEPRTKDTDTGISSQIVRIFDDEIVITKFWVNKLRVAFANGNTTEANMIINMMSGSFPGDE